MTTITASDLKQNSMRLQDALRDDLLVTKRDKPFVVVMDYEKYIRLQAYLEKIEERQPATDKYPSISFEEASQRVGDAVDRYRNDSSNTISMDEMRQRLKRRRDNL
jgi:prevent-host-death family protein